MCRFDSEPERVLDWAMYSASDKGDWYGLLKTKKLETVVIRDAGLPKAEHGKVYLYNTERDAIIEYVEDIVKSKLRDLSPDEQKQAKKLFHKNSPNKRSRLKSFLKFPVQS